MKRISRITLWALLLLVGLGSAIPPAAADSEKLDLTPRLVEIYQRRAQWLLTGQSDPPIEGDYLPGSTTARWALAHERGKLRYMKTWAENRHVRIVEANPSVKAKTVSERGDRVRFYVEQSLAVGYVYPGESQVNRFGVGTRHIIELRRAGDQWLIGMEWYSDPLGDDTETPAIAPALVPEPLNAVQSQPAATRRSARRGYDRAGAVAYMDKYCGLAWGCGNGNRYNRRYRDYSGVGGDCTNFLTQALRDGGKLNVPTMTFVSSLASHLQYSGRAAVAARDSFENIWKGAQARSEGFRALLREGDLIAYQEKGKMAHFAMVTEFDSHGYPLVNSHSLDRYHVPFDLGWDRKTVYWFFRMRD